MVIFLVEFFFVGVRRECICGRRICGCGGEIVGNFDRLGGIKVLLVFLDVNIFDMIICWSFWVVNEFRLVFCGVVSGIFIVILVLVGFKWLFCFNGVFDVVLGVWEVGIVLVFSGVMKLNKIGICWDVIVVLWEVFGSIVLSGVVV